LKRAKKDKKRKSSNDKEALLEKKRKLKTVRKNRGKPPTTSDGKNIKELMIEEGIKGDYRDYAILLDDKIIDYKKTIVVSTKDGKPITLSSELALIHKKKLRNLVSKDVAEQFWNLIYGRV
jgi:hypothetical protein